MQTNASFRHSPAGVRAALRARTAAAHASAERTGRLAALGSGRMSRAEYVAYLQRQGALTLALEDWLEDARPAAYPIAWLCRAARVRADAHALGITLDAGSARPAVAALAAACVDDDARWGVLYVLEGAALGGQVLSRRNAALPHVRCADRHLRGDADADAGRWRAFVALLEREVVDVDAAVAGALHAFQLIGTFVGGAPATATPSGSADGLRH